MHRLGVRVARAAAACVAAAALPAAVAFSDSNPRSVAQETATSFVPTKASVAARMDHTLLRADAVPDEIAVLCKEAHGHGFATVCVSACYVPLAHEILVSLGSTVKVCAVVGFPLGNTSTETKVYEARQAIRDGASEIDMVLNVGWLKARKLEAVITDIADVVRECRMRGAICKVIIETALLTHEEKLLATSLAISAGADFVKTSTGFSTAGATIEDVEELAQLAHRAGARFKASGGVRDGLTALGMIAAGADRIGASKSVQICEEAARILEQGEAALVKTAGKKSGGY